MADVQIKTLKDGPYQVKGKDAYRLIDAQGDAFALSADPIYLCRCGQSANKPFCDGTHKRIGFQSDEPAR